jgi:NAD(P)H dehydrogenase (quinone)
MAKKRRDASKLKNLTKTILLLKAPGFNYPAPFLFAEYLREANYRVGEIVPEDVRAEQEKINRSDAIVFIYPVFWTEPPQNWSAGLTGFGPTVFPTGKEQ